MKNFKDLKIWQKGIGIALRSYDLTGTFPREEKYGLVGQINRAAVSIASNIAEGCSRKSERDYYRFLEIALGSVFELETQLTIAKSMRFGNFSAYDELLNEIDQEQKMLMGFMSKLNK